MGAWGGGHSCRREPCRQSHRAECLPVAPSTRLDSSLKAVTAHQGDPLPPAPC